MATKVSNSIPSYDPLPVQQQYNVIVVYISITSTWYKVPPTYFISVKKPSLTKYVSTESWTNVLDWKMGVRIAPVSLSGLMPSWTSLLQAGRHEAQRRALGCCNALQIKRYGSTEL